MGHGLFRRAAELKLDWIIPLKTRSGQIYRFRFTADLAELPASAGIYCFAHPQAYPGAPISPVYWGTAIADFSIEIPEDPARVEALSSGARHIGTLEVKGRLARKRILRDLVESISGERDELVSYPQKRVGSASNGSDRL